jgi:hypothetical protein
VFYREADEVAVEQACADTDTPRRPERGNDEDDVLCTEPETRDWLELNGGVGAGRDSNVLLVGPGPVPPGGKRDTHYLAAFGADYRRTRFNDEARSWELGAVADAGWVEQQSIDEASQFAWGAASYLDVDLRGKRLDPPRTHRAGLLLRHSEGWLDDDAFAETEQAVLGWSMAFRRSDSSECELDRLRAYYSFEDVDDQRPEDDPALDRDGHVTAIGIGGTLTQSQKVQDGWDCYGGGTFRRLFVPHYWTLHGDYERRWERTVGSEFRRRLDLVRLDAHVPLYPTRVGHTPRLILDANLTYGRSSASEPSVFGPGERDGDTLVGDLGFLHPLRYQSDLLPLRYTDVWLRAGVQHTTERSQVDELDYERAVYGVSLWIVRGRHNLNRIVRLDPENPGSGGGGDTGSGPTRPNPGSGP